MTIFVYDIVNKGAYIKTVGVETGSEKDALTCIRTEYPNNTINLVRRMDILLKNVSIEDDYTDPDYERFNRTQKEYGFRTVWSLYDVKNIEDLSPYTFNRVELSHMSNASMVMSLNRHTWLDIWGMVDKLVKIHDPAHPYIEGFRAYKNTLYVTTGS